MVAIARTIIVLDQAAGSVRVDDDRPVGLDLQPATAEWIGQQAEIGRPITLALPGEVGRTATDPAAGVAERLSVAAGAGLIAFLPDEPNAATTEHPAFLVPSDTDPGTTAFVCADRQLRGRARDAGMVAAAHPAVLPLLSDDDETVAVRCVGPRATLERFAAGTRIVPMHFQPVQGSAEWALIGLAGRGALAAAAGHRLWAQPLDVDPGVEDLAWVRSDAAVDPEAPFATANAGLRIVFAEPGQLLVALGPSVDSESLGVHGAHGHTELLMPDPGLLQPPRSADPTELFGPADLVAPRDAAAPPSPILEEVRVDPAVRQLIATTRPGCGLATTGYAAYLDRYTGVLPLNADGPVISRHIQHPDNKRVEAQLLADLRDLGYCPWRHEFLHNGVVHSNVIADLPGTGAFRIRPEILDRLRRILTDGDRADLVAELRSFDGADELAQLPELQLRRELERLLALEPWNPWWRLRCPMAGLGAGLVIVGGHLDSTAGFDPGYSPSTDAAPGRDDNGSGLAAVLTLARNLRRLAGKLTHTVRFCFFNAEEAGLVGSKAYAALLKSQRAPVRAVYCTDMMGYNGRPDRLFELHAGYTDPAVRDISVPLAERVAAAAAEQGTLLPAQIYRGTIASGGPDRSVFDGAINRSDHASFQQQGWPAVLASEDFFANLPGQPVADANPNYHRSGDQVVDNGYAKAITCAIGRAATLSAL